MSVKAVKKKTTRLHVVQKGMTTIEDMEWALKNDPKSIDKYKAQITIKADLEEYMQSLYDNQITTNVLTKLKRTQGRTLGIHPSSACKKGVCQLKLYYECTGELEARRSYDPKMQEIWDLGTMLHDRLQTFLSDMYGDQFEPELVLSIPSLHIIGHTDGLFTFEAHDGVKAYRFILEIKSIKEGGNFGFEKVQKKPFADNIRQSHFYMKAKNVPFSLVFYIAKNTGDLLEHVVTWDPEIWTDIKKTIKAPIAAAYGDSKTNVTAKPGWHCRWCDYEYACAAAQRKKGGRGAKGSKTWSRKKK